MTPPETREADPARPVRPTLSRPYIVATTLAMVDRDGLAKLSMRRLGAELGVDPMAVYHYFPSKADLFDGLVEAVFAEVRLPDQPEDRPWVETLTEYMGAVRATLRAHPAALPVIATRPVKSQAVLAMVETVAARLVRAGATPADALDAINCLVVFATGHALAEVGEPVGGPDSPEFRPDQLDLAAIPTLVAAISNGYEYDADAQFSLGLGSMLDGLGTRLGLT